MSEARVLVVDDDAALLRALPQALQLRMEGVEVDVSDSATAALTQIAAHDYDAIVSDIKMPGMDGLALLAEIRLVRPTTPTLLITGHGEHELAIQALRGGAYDFIQKPIDRDYFVASLARAIQMRQLDRRVEQQKLALERHARVLEHVGDGVFLIDSEGIVRLWNRAAQEITGLPRESALGRRAEEVLPRWEAVAGRLRMSNTPGSASGDAETVPFELHGRELWLSMSAVTSSDGIIYAFRDVTDERAVEELKTDFVATASHELRTPLAAVYGAALTLRRDDIALEEEKREHLLQLIVEESERLTRIIGDILLASHLDSGHLQLARERIDPIELVRSVVEPMRSHVPTNVTIDFVAGDSLPRVVTDAGKLRQVLMNLIDNAVKYSPEGGRVEVRISCEASSLCFSVRDEGLGIPLREQAHIFKKFYRVDPNLTGGINGTGLGLYICRELVRRMRGRLWLKSEEGKGSTFFVELPLQRTEQDGTAARNHGKYLSSVVRSRSR